MTVKEFMNVIDNVWVAVYDEHGRYIFEGNESMVLTHPTVGHNEIKRVRIHEHYGVEIYV